MHVVCTCVDCDGVKNISYAWRASVYIYGVDSNNWNVFLRKLHSIKWNKTHINRKKKLNKVKRKR